MTPDPPRFLSIGHLLPMRGWKMDAHVHPFHELIVVIGGRLGVEIRGQLFEAGPGEVVLYPQGERHREWTEDAEPVESYYIGFDMPELSATDIHERDEEGRIHSLAQWLYAERELRVSSVPSIAQNAFLQAMLAEFNRLGGRQENLLVARMRAFMRHHLAQPLSLDGLARHIGMSKYHFVRKYKMLTGRTPMQDLQHVRSQAARDLLLTTNLPLKEIAPRTGLGDEYHLSRVFKSIYNSPPGRLRKGITSKSIDDN